MKNAVIPLGSRVIPEGGGKIFAPGVLTVQIADGLVDLGHDVDLFSPIGTETRANLKSFQLKSMFEQFGDLKEQNPAAYTHLQYQYDLFNIAHVAENSKQYDIVHAHDLRKAMFFSKLTSCPITYTYHGNPNDDMQYQIERERMKKYREDNYFIAISNRQAELAKPNFNIASVVHHGIDFENIPFDRSGNEKLLYVGRLIDRKQPHLAIDVAEKLNKVISIVGDANLSPGDIKYFEDTVKPKLDQDFVEYLGLVPHPEVLKYYSAKALLLPLKWEEPFGLVMIEAMAAGTPVIAFANGSSPEIIQDGITGFLVNTDKDNVRGDWIIKSYGFEGLIEAVNRIYSMTNQEYSKMRELCRRHVEENFSVSKMVKGYDLAFRKIISEYKKRTQ